MVGDRILTDVVLANRMRSSSQKAEQPTDRIQGETREWRPEGPLGIYVDKVWKKDAVVLRALERGLLRLTERYTIAEEEKEVQRRISKSFIRYTA